MGAEDFGAYGLAGAPSLLLHVGAVDPAVFAAAQKSGTRVPSLHSPLFAPDYEPTIKTATTAETAALLDLLGIWVRAGRPAARSPPDQDAVG